MSCFYCGKRVSLVRKRTDPDFCSEEHREKYHARTRRGMDQLLEAEERATATRRLSEGFPLRPSVFPQRGAPLENLISRHPGPYAVSEGKPTSTGAMCARYLSM